MRFVWLALGSGIALSSCLFPPVIELSKCHDGACEHLGGESAGGSPPGVGGADPVGAGGVGVGGGAGLQCDPPTTYADMVLCDDPLAYFRLGESAGDLKAKDERSVLTADCLADFGHPGAIAGDPDTSVYFEPDGYWDHQVVDFGERFAFEGAATFTFELWVKPLEGPGSIAWMGKDDFVAGKYTGNYMTSNGIGAAQFCRRATGDQPNECASGDEAMVVDDWVHLVTTFNGALLTLYVNGAPQDDQGVYGTKTDPVVNLPSVEHPFRLGNAFHFESMRGYIDEFAVYEDVLTPAQICAHYEMGSGADAKCPE